MNKAVDQLTNTAIHEVIMQAWSKNVVSPTFVFLLLYTQFIRCT